MSPQEVLNEVKELGFHLALRPGGLRLSGARNPPKSLLDLITEQRPALLTMLEEEAALWAAHEISLNAGRMTTLHPRLLPLLHPSLQDAVRPSNYRLGLDPDHAG